MNYVINTYGCQMNVHESEKIAGILTGMGYSEGSDESRADIIVYNTCCIRETAEQKIYGHIGKVKKYKKANPDIIVVLCGCMTQQDGVADQIKQSYPYVDIVLGSSNLDKLQEAIGQIIDGRKKFVNTDFNIAAEDTLPQVRTSAPNAWVNIIYGCNNFCTYCIVPYVRGRERSRSIESVLAEVKSLLAEGYKEITLLGQNVNSYGHDLKDGTNFATLLCAIGSLPGKFRLRFMTSHPKDLTDDVIEAVAKYPNICNYIHLPVQSGSDDVLRRMNRKYDRKHYLELIEKIRRAIPDVGITTDIMVGFPGETEQDFCDTLDLVRKAEYSSAFCFVYSRRKGTPAYDMPNQIDDDTKRQRITKLLAEQNKITRKISKSMHGKTYEILVEGRGKGEDVYCGRTESGRLVNVHSKTNIIGEFVDVVIETSASATLWGKLVEKE